LARTCTICIHVDREKIDRLIVEGRSYRNIAKQFSLSDTAVYRHKAHLNRTLIKAKEAETVAHADNLLDQVKDLQAKALDILSKCEKSKDWKTALSAIREARGCLELLGKLAAELQSAPTVNILISPEWVRIRTLILETLESYPDARLAIAKALRSLDNACGSD